jgi:hypothetical protein
MTQDIVIGGVSIQELKKQRDAMKQEASVFVSDNVAAGVALVEEILEGNENTNFQQLAEEALKKLDAANLVSAVCDVEFYLDYYEEWGDGNPLTHRLKSQDNGNIPSVYGNDALGKLFDLLGDMEFKSKGWHQSTC